MNPVKSLLRTMARWSIATQLYAGFGAVLGLMALLGGLSLVALHRVDVQAESLADKWMRSVGHLSEMRLAMNEARDFEIKHSRATDRSYQSEYEEKIANALKQVADQEAAALKLLTTPAEREMGGKLESTWQAYLKFSGQVLALGRDKKQQDAADISDGAASMSIDEALGALNALNRYSFEQGEVAGKATAAIYTEARWGVLGLMLVALAFVLGMALAITRRLIRQLGGEPVEAMAVASAVASGDLTTRIVLRPGDTSSLMARLQTMQEGLVKAVTQVRQGSERVATASLQIADGNLDLSGRTEQQASALQQTTATMEELGSTVRSNADSARQAEQLARGASTVAVQGGERVGEVVQTMKGINDSSRKIADIISVIDGIAFQTNILALNAAVEAARAGEQGRGFAVVASEVRSLAQRSATAAREIKDLINASVQRVEQGSAQVDQAGQTMQEIVSAINRVTGIVAEISTASAEQSSGVGQVCQAVSQMDQATQQNAALVEQSAAAAESLKLEAQQLVQAVAVFRVS